MNSDFKQHIINSLKHNTRGDGRKCDEFRDIKIETGITKTAEGSARIIMGETEVIAGVKLGVGEPFPDSPDAGIIMVNAELLPLSNPDFESGPPGIQAVELSRIVDRGIRESKAIDMKDLVIRKGEKCWMVQIDICTINDAGNLLDASALAALAALNNTYFPKYENDEIDYKTKTDKKFELKKFPITVTVSKIGSELVVDPVTEEENYIDARLTVAITGDNTICALQKGEQMELSLGEVDKMLNLASEKASQIRKKLAD
ncbi:MAG: exosome complex protein Rrp42 [Candidatus Nanoarchaeia archaeon]